MPSQPRQVDPSRTRNGRRIALAAAAFLLPVQLPVPPRFFLASTTAVSFNRLPTSHIQTTGHHQHEGASKQSTSGSLIRQVCSRAQQYKTSNTFLIAAAVSAEEGEQQQDVLVLDSWAEASNNDNDVGDYGNGDTRTGMTSSSTSGDTPYQSAVEASSHDTGRRWQRLRPVVVTRDLARTLRTHRFGLGLGMSAGSSSPRVAAERSEQRDAELKLSTGDQVRTILFTSWYCCTDSSSIDSMPYCLFSLYSTASQ